MLSNIFWLGHAAFKIVEIDKVIYLDPYQIKSSDKADLILVTHDHFDHFSKEDIKKITKDNTIIIGPEKIKNDYFKNFNLLQPGKKIEIQDIIIEGVSAYNINKHFHKKTDDNLGFVIKLKDKSIYHAGDTDFIPEMEKLNVDIALLPVGGTYTMNAEEAAKAANAVKAKVAVPMHWGNIVGTREDAEKFKKLCKCQVEILNICQ